MIKAFKLKFGSHPNRDKLVLETTPITIFVGPNNSGKSKILTELHQFCSNGISNSSFCIIEDVIFDNIPKDRIKEEIDNNTLIPKVTEQVELGNIIFGDGNTRNQIKPDLASKFLELPNNNKQAFCRYYLSYKTIKLDALNRIHLINEQSLGDLQQIPQNNLSILFKDDSKRLEVRRIIFDAFGEYFVLDPTKAGMLRIRLSKTKPKGHEIERGLHNEAIEFHNNALLMTRCSDGVKAFTGIVTSIIAGNPKVTIIDEPEAFLHPSLAFKLGKEIASSAKNGLNTLFIATHSSNFLMGCIQSGSPINIIRLTYSNETSTARLLNKDKIGELMKDPLLRSTGVLNALFYKYVIVTEGDSDRAFYQEINERLSEFKSDNSIPNCLFINAVGKDTIWKIVKPLREMGIPTIGIYDIDILKNEGQNWTNALKSGFVPDISHQSLGQTRSALKNKFNELCIDMKKDGGIEALDSSDKEAANNLFDQLEEYGIFIVRRGEVEHWLSYLGVKSHKSIWLSEIFEKMGSDSSTPEYVKPIEGDVWDFIGRARKWMMNEKRKGIPE